MVTLKFIEMVTCWLTNIVIQLLAKLVTKALKRKNPAAIGLRG